MDVYTRWRSTSLDKILGAFSPGSLNTLMAEVKALITLQASSFHSEYIVLILSI